MNIKKIIVLTLFFSIFLHCFGGCGPGVTDYSIDLPGAYVLHRTSGDVIFIQYKNKDYLCKGAEGAIRHFAYDEEYIYFETELSPLSETGIFIYSAINYKTKEYYEVESYDELCQALNKEPIEYEEWLSTSLSEIDWTDSALKEEQLAKFNAAISQNDESDQYYKIFELSGNYYCDFYNTDGYTVRSEGPFVKAPDVIVIENQLICCSLQTGTGIETCWTFYYDIVNEVFSETFLSVFDRNERKIVYANLEKIIVRDIFDSNLYYKEFSQFKQPFSPVAAPITDAKFSDGGKTLTVTYLTGSDYKEVAETFELS